MTKKAQKKWAKMLGKRKERICRLTSKLDTCGVPLVVYGDDDEVFEVTCIGTDGRSIAFVIETSKGDK